MNSEKIDSLQHLATKSNEYLKEFSSTFTNNHSKATTIISAIAIFIPLFFNIVKDESVSLIIVSAIPLLFIIISLFFALWVIIPKRFPYGFKIEKFKELVANELEANLGYELGVNIQALEISEKIIMRQGRRLKLSIVFMTISLVLSIVLILGNKMN